jgi:hypothetical protein
VGQIAHQAAKDHQPSCLSRPIVQSRKLARKKLHEIVEADPAPINVPAGKARRQKPVDNVMMKIASGAR